MKSLAIKFDNYKFNSRRYPSDITYETGRGNLLNTVTKKVVTNCLVPRLNIPLACQGDSFVVIPGKILKGWFDNYKDLLYRKESLLKKKYWDTKELIDILENKMKLEKKNDYEDRNEDLENKNSIPQNEMLNSTLCEVIGIKK